MHLKSLSDDLCRIGRSAGLDAIGICDAAPFPHARASLVAGLEQGWDAGMQFTYRNPDRSTDPRRLVKGAAAMIVGARRYDRQPPTSPDRDRERPLGAVARYAWKDHYKELRASLGQMADHLRSKGWQAAVVVDDNGLVDRAAAVRAGIGWYGKNTNVLIPGAGSWFVLGSVVTDAPLLRSDQQSWKPNEPSTAITAAETQNHFQDRAKSSAAPARTLTLTPGPVDDGCGTCRRCIDACPTGALSEHPPGHLDARKCLAWLVQAPGVFPREYRVALHDRIYGCDDCQEVCPVNRLAQRRSPPETADNDATVAVDVLAMLEASDVELLEQFGRWYIPHRDPKYLRRNALVVLGNIAEPKSAATRSAVAKATLDPDPIIRAHAVWAAARLGYTDLTPASDPDPIVEEEIAASQSVPSRAVA